MSDSDDTRLDLPEWILRSSQHFPLLVLIMGPSGVGKDAAIRRMRARGVIFTFVRTVTTRPRRPDELDENDYSFISEDEYERLLGHNSFLEHAEVYGYRYGILRSTIQEALDAGHDIVLRIGIKAIGAIKEAFPAAVTILIAPPTLDELALRLRKRGPENERNLDNRVAQARRELEAGSSCDYVVVNHHEQLDQTVDIILSIMAAERCRVHV